MYVHALCMAPEYVKIPLNDLNMHDVKAIQSNWWIIIQLGSDRHAAGVEMALRVNVPEEGSKWHWWGWVCQRHTDDSTACWGLRVCQRHATSGCLRLCFFPNHQSSTLPHLYILSLFECMGKEGSYLYSINTGRYPKILSGALVLWCAVA